MTSLDSYITLGRSGLRVSPLSLGHHSNPTPTRYASPIDRLTEQPGLPPKNFDAKFRLHRI
jgi:hypothetical protein